MLCNKRTAEDFIKPMHTTITQILLITTFHGVQKRKQTLSENNVCQRFLGVTHQKVGDTDI